MAVVWDDLHSFLCVSRAGSFVRAAKELGVEHTTVARRLDRLERSLGTALVHRGTRGVKLTAAGEALAVSLAHTEAEVLAATGVASEQDAHISGSVRIATAEIFATAFLCEQLPELAVRYPALSIKLLTGQAPVDLSKGEADLAVRLLPPGKAPAEMDVLARRVGRFGFRLYASRGYLAAHPVSSDLALSGHEVIRYAAMPRAPGEAWLLEHGGTSHTALFASAVPVLTAAAVAGIGLAVLPAFYADREPDLVALSASVSESIVWLLVRPEMKRSRRVSSVHSWLAKVIADRFGARRPRA
jgi:DNA-binding transcriptional LysR family regulator